MTIYEFAAERGYAATNEGARRILQYLCEVRGTDKEEKVLSCLRHNGELCELWRAYRTYEAQQNAKQTRLLI